MSNWTISKKIALGFLAVLIQAISVDAYALWKSAQADRRLEQVSLEYLPEAELASSLERELLNARIHFIYYVTVQKPGSLDQAWARFHAAQTVLPKLLGIARSSNLFAPIRPDAERLRESVVAYQPALERLVDIVQRKENSGGGFADLLNRLSALGNEMVESAGRLYQHGMRGTDQWANGASTRGETAMLTFGCLAAVLLGILVTLYVTRDVFKRLRSVTCELGSAARHVARGASRIAASARSLSDGASSQAASLQQTSASTDQINSMAEQNAAHSKSAAGNVVQAAAQIAEANLNLEQMVGSMNAINDSSARISKIIKVIDEIAFQTNILALNAAVEAARAGDAGMGFAVVADEVRNLAQRSAQAAKDTTVLIEESIARSTDGKNKLHQVAGAMRAVTEQSGRVRTLVDELSQVSHEQARGIQQISGAVAQIGQVTHNAAATAEESSAAAEDLTGQSEVLNEIVARLNGMVGECLLASTESRQTGPSASATGMFDWDKRFEIGIEAIDSQHKRLFELVAGLHEAMRNGGGQTGLARLLNELVRYTRVHFQTEERLMRGCAFPDYQAHKKMHDDLTAQVQQFATDYQSGRANLTVDLLKFLRDWLYHHILKSDKRYASYLAAS